MRTLALFLALTAGPAVLAAVTVEPAAQDFVVTGTQYRTRVAADGALPSLVIHGQEFIDGAVSRGVYLYDTTTMRFAGVSQVDGTTLKAESKKATLLYQFSDNAITLKMTNQADKPIQLVIVYHLDVKAVRDEQGRYHKPPLNREWPNTV
jgi:hypothetical protein